MTIQSKVELENSGKVPGTHAKQADDLEKAMNEDHVKELARWSC